MPAASIAPEISRIEDASTARWLVQALEPARARIRRAPTQQAVERIRMRVFGEGARKPRQAAAA